VSGGERAEGERAEGERAEGERAEGERAESEWAGLPDSGFRAITQMCASITAIYSI
jgi:hypothetical protein